MALTGKNISLPIYTRVNGVETPFHNLVLKKFTVDSVVMSLGDKITGDVYYKDKDLECSMQEYVVFDDIEYTIVNPPTLVKEGMVADNSDLKGMSKYSFEFYHPMYLLGNLPFTDVAVSYDELRYKSQDKTFSWIGKPADFVAKLNKNLDSTEWVVVLSDRFPLDKLDELSEVLSFDNNTIADVLKTGYETWGTPFVVDKLHEGEYYHTDSNNIDVDYYMQGKRFVVVFGLPSNEIYETETDDQPFVFRFGQGVGLKNNSRTPRNNKIVTRIAGYGSENNIPYGYPQIRWYGDSEATCTIGDSVGPKQNVTINGVTYDWAMSYPIYDGIVGGEWVKLIKHPFTRNHLMPTVYANGVFNKVSQFLADGSANTNFNPDIEIKDYYDAVEGGNYQYVNIINPVAPSYEIHGFDDIKPELGEAYILGATPINADLTDADSWDDTMDDNGNYLQSYFKITLPQLSFDIYACAAITQEMQINMRSGACIGCTFTAQVDWEDYKRNFYDSDMNFVPNGSQRDYTRYPDSSQGSITVVVQKDINTFGTLMPNIYQNPASGDAFVILGISLPLSYITSAQERLDDAMKSYMLENNLYYFDYPLKFDEYFLANNVGILNQIRPNSIIRFDFNDEDLELFVKQLTIKFNEGKLPQYDITLTDNVEIVLNQIGQVADDVEHLGTLISILRQQYSKNIWAELAKKLSKVNDDIASGLISFAQGWETLGFFSNSFLGNGAKVDVNGNGEFESISIRGALRAAELVFNRISAEEGEAIRSIGHGEILSVDEENMIATLKLDGDEWATIDVDDICRGLYNTINKGYDNANSEGQDENGFRLKAGFFASYFKVEEILSSGKGECTFRYSLQPNTTEHPCPLMKFAVYGNFNRYNEQSKKARQSSMYITAVGIAPRLLFLAGVNDWQIKPQNIKAALGNLEGLQVYEKSGDSVVLKQLHGDAGLFVEDNVYLGGVIEQFIHANLDDILAELGQGIHAELTRGSDNIVVDALGNIVGGIYYEYSGGNRHYRLHTGILVYDSGKKRYLTPSSGSTIGENEFAIYYNCEGCDVIRDGADFYVTNIHNTNDGISDTTLTDAELEQMRNTEECKVNFTIVTHNGWRTIISYPIRITHLDHGYITFSLDNEFDSIAYRTQTKKYDGLPVETHIRGYVNGEEVGVVSTSVKTNFTTSDMSEETLTADGDTIVTRYFRNDSASGVKMELTKAGKLTLKAYTKSSDDIDYDDTFYYFDIKSVVKYAGVLYESAWRRFTLTEITDSTLYKLLLSATAVSKDGGTFTPSTVDVKVQVSNNNGTSVAVPDEYGNIAGIAGIKVRYLKGVYSPNGTNNWLTSMPSFADPSVTTCVTVACVDMSGNHPLVLDIQSITINAVGKDGAGQPYVKTNIDQYVVDCDSNGLILANNGVTIDTLTIDAELYWGDNKCGLTNSQCVVRYKGSTVTHSYDSIGESISVSLSFVSGQSLSSGNVEISLVGIDGGGDSHSAIKTIAIIANRQGRQGDKGDNGNDGNGIDGVVTYYLATTKFTGVTTSDTGWVEYFVEPTAELPYLWRFTRYTYTTNGSTPYDTPCELVKTYYTDGNPNLLGDALFIADSMGAWDKKGALSSSVEVADNFTPVFATSSSFNAQTNGHRQFRGTFKAKSTEGYITLLSQFVNKDTGLSKVEASQWYTLSFLLYGTRDDQTNADFILAADVSQIADSNVNVFIDGQERPASYAYRNFTVTDTFTRHTMTFKAKSSLSGDLSVVWYMHPRTYTQNVYISEPKLELGKVATQFSAAPFIDKPMTRTSTWQEGMDYQAGQQGEKYLDIVDYNGGWYRCQKSHISTNANKPNEAQQYTEYWFKANKFEFIATNLLLANEAFIENLGVGILRTGSYPYPHVEMRDAKAKFYGKHDFPNIELAVDEDDNAVLRFYDKFGNAMYDLGPSGIMQNFSQVPTSYADCYYKPISSSSGVMQLVVVSNNSVSGVGQNGDNVQHRYLLSEGYKALRTGSSIICTYSISNDTSPSAWNRKTVKNNTYDDVNDLRGVTPVGSGKLIDDGWYCAVVINPVDTEGHNVEIYHFVGGLIITTRRVYFKDNDIIANGANAAWYDENGNNHQHQNLSVIMNDNLTPYQ